jgi:uncharacterized protein (TIGR02145 family)
MKTTSVVLLLIQLCIVNGFGQKLSVDLTFTAVNNAAHVQLDSIKVMNRSQGSENTLYYPDTAISIEISTGDTLLYIGYSTGNPIGVREINQENSSFHLFPAYPNPLTDQCMISMYLPEDGNVITWVNDIQGKVILSNDQFFEKGIHSFRFFPGNSSLYLLSARWKGVTLSIKMINAETGTMQRCMLDYLGSVDQDLSSQASAFKTDQVMLESGILDAPSANETFTFQFATNIPCLGTPTVTYEGQVYNTIQIFSQCWLKENLNVGTMINGTSYMTENDTLEKYCYDNDPANCTEYGGLYQWDEVMQYTTQPGTRGICPPGWHLPTDEEWKVMEGAVDKQYGIGDSAWDTLYYRGFDAGYNLKTTTGWNFLNSNGIDLFDYSAKPAGIRLFYGNFVNLEGSTVWWSSNEYNSTHAIYRTLSTFDNISRDFLDKVDGFSVRCIRDY